MPTQISTSAEILGRNRGYVFMKLHNLWPTRILTFPDKVLPRGTKRALTVEVLVDPKSLRYTEGGTHLIADLKVTNVLKERPPDPDPGDSG